MSGNYTIQPIGQQRATWFVLDEIDDERRKQDDMWGEQNHPDMDPVQSESGRIYFSELADHYKCINARDVGTERFDWTGILLEEVYEACASEGAELREELVQVAAVAVAWIEAIDRRAGA